MNEIWFTLALLAFSAFLSLFYNRHPGRAALIGLAGTIGACLAGMIPVWRVLIDGALIETSLPWVFGIEVHLGLDPLSAFFLLVLLVASFAASIYGFEYISKWYGKKSIGVFTCFFNLLIASLITVLIAQNGLFFLIAWEAMSVTSFFLVSFENEKKKVRRADLIYLFASNISAAFLIGFFILMDTGQTLNFDACRTAIDPLIFCLALIGFGIKAGFFPFHVWLPEAHPAAPSHVSALMSGVMIKMGIYGLMRLITFVDMPPMWWGGVLIGLGITSGIVGITFAMGQYNLKRLLAYSSIEHIGIIISAMGLGIFGLNLHQPLIAMLGFGGAIFHVMNHSIFKNLLFLGSGAILHATNSLDVNNLGGLFQRMPKTGFYFLIGVLSISAIPAFNGFFSEFMIYLASFTGIIASPSPVFICVILAMCLIGALTLAAFSSIFGIIFLGTPRSNAAERAHEMGRPMRFAMGLLASLCVLTALLFPLLVKVLSPAIGEIAKTSNESASLTILGGIEQPFYPVIAISTAIFAIAWAVWQLRKRRLSRSPCPMTNTWDCGFASPTPRMQYSFSSFVLPLFTTFKQAALPLSPKKIFPENESMNLTPRPDPIETFMNHYLLRKLSRFTTLLHWIQHGYLNLYILYIFVTLLLLLVFKFR